MTHRQHRPHVSLTVAESLAGADLSQLRALLRTRPPTLHAATHAALAGQPVSHWPHYLPGSWIPHCTLAEGLSQAQAAAAFGLLYG